MIVFCVYIIYVAFINPLWTQYAIKQLHKKADDLDLILRTIYHSNKRPLIKLENRVYNYPNCYVYIRKENDRQLYMNDLYNLRNEPILKDWKLKYENSRTLVYSNDIYNIILKFS